MYPKGLLTGWKGFGEKVSFGQLGTICLNRKDGGLDIKQLSLMNGALSCNGFSPLLWKGIRCGEKL